MLRFLSKRKYRSATTPVSQDSSKKQVNKNILKCRILLLDGTDLAIEIPKKALARDLYEEVFYTLDLIEKDYFGLQFTDANNIKHWLDPTKPVKKQVKIGPPYTLHLRVKFYSSEPNSLQEELTRYQCFLQLKQDILSGRLPCPENTAVELAALAMQSELGDYNASQHPASTLSQYRFIPGQTAEFELRVAAEWPRLRGTSPAHAELLYLHRAKWLELYGVSLHPVVGKDGAEYRLGLSPTGVLVFEGGQKIGLFLWPRIRKLNFRKRKLTLVVQEDEEEHIFMFKTHSDKSCKNLWKCAIEYHAFYRLRSTATMKQVQRGFGDKDSDWEGTGRLFGLRLSSRFRYSGKTEYESVRMSRERRRRRLDAEDSEDRKPKWERRPSEKFAKRMCHVLREREEQLAAEQKALAEKGLADTDPSKPDPDASTSDQPSLTSMDAQKPLNHDQQKDEPLLSLEKQDYKSVNKQINSTDETKIIEKALNQLDDAKKSLNQYYQLDKKSLDDPKLGEKSLNEFYMEKNNLDLVKNFEKPLNYFEGKSKDDLKKDDLKSEPSDSKLKLKQDQTDNVKNGHKFVEEKQNNPIYQNEIVDENRSKPSSPVNSPTSVLLTNNTSQQQLSDLLKALVKGGAVTNTSIISNDCASNENMDSLQTEDELKDNRGVMLKGKNTPLVGMTCNVLRDKSKLTNQTTTVMNEISDKNLSDSHSATIISVGGDKLTLPVTFPLPSLSPTPSLSIPHPSLIPTTPTSDNSSDLSVSVIHMGEAGKVQRQSHSQITPRAENHWSNPFRASSRTNPFLEFIEREEQQKQEIDTEQNDKDDEISQISATNTASTTLTQLSPWLVSPEVEIAETTSHIRRSVITTQL